MKLYRCRWNRKLAGVCGGLGAYLKVDPTIVRLAVIVLLFPSFGLMALLYLLGWWLISEGPKAYIEPKYKALYRLKRNRVFGGICAGIAAFFSVDANLVRLVTVVVAFFTGFFPILFGYLVGLMIIPER